MIAKLVEKTEVAEKLFILKVVVKRLEIEPKPCQFFMLYPPSADKILGRPMSVFGFSTNKGQTVIEFLLKKVGGGTSAILDLSEGAELRVLGPLGNGFDISQLDSKLVWLVAGGYGVAPLRFLAKEVLASGKDAYLIYGTRAACDAVDCKVLGLPSDRVFCASESEPASFLGTAFDLWVNKVSELGGGVTVACGPVGLLKALQRSCEQKKLKLFVSLEARMGCGFGVCFSCAIPKAGGGYARACYEGPVFDAASIDWERLESS